MLLEKLQAEAALQARLEQQRLLPVSLDAVTSLIGRYPWQVVLVISGSTALAVEVVKWLT